MLALDGFTILDRLVLDLGRGAGRNGKNRQSRGMRPNGWRDTRQLVHGLLVDRLLLDDRLTLDCMLMLDDGLTLDARLLLDCRIG